MAISDETCVDVVISGQKRDLMGGIAKNEMCNGVVQLLRQNTILQKFLMEALTDQSANIFH